MALETGGVDPGAVSTILNRLKSQGIFDQFRRDCLADVDTKPAYQNLRQRVESYVSNFLSRFTWTPEMNKNQLRDRLRRQINQSDMLASGVDRIIEQVVEPKMQHVFRPQIEKVVNQYLHSETIVNGDEEIPKKNGTLMDDLPPINTTEVPMMTPPEERVLNTSPDVPSPPPEQPPLPPTPAIDDDEKMPPPPQPPPPPLPPCSEELTINTEGPVILPSPAFEPIGSSPPHPGASFLNKEFVDSPIPEPLSDGLPMDFSQSPDQGSFKGRHVTDPTDVKSLLSRTVFAKKAGRSIEGDLTSPQTSDLSPISDGMSSYTNEKKFDTRQAGTTKGTKYSERDSSSSSSSPKSRAKLAADGQRLALEASSPGTWSTKSSTSLPKIGKRDNLEGSPGSLSTPSTPEKTVKSEYERKLEIKRKVKNLIKQNIKIRDKRESSESSGGDSSPDVRFRGDSEHRRTAAATPSPDRHRKDYRSPEKKSRSKRSWEQMVRPEDALRAISPEVISDEELEKKSVKDASDVERSEGELVSSEEDGKKDLADLGNLSDITVSSVHTSDLSSFSDVSSSSSTSGSDNEDERKAKESSGPTTNLKSIPKQYQSKAFPPHFDSSEDEATREERKKRAAVAKEERVRRRQLQKEEKEKQLRLAKSRERESKEAEEKPAEKRKIDDDLSPVSTDTDSRDEMGDSPEAREADVTAKPVKKRRRSSEEEKPQVEVYPTYVTSTSKRKRRQASVKDSFLLTQNVSGAKLLKRRKKKVNNRSGSKLFFRMGGQSGGNTPKRSASPRMGGPSVSQPEGHLVSKAVAKLEETQQKDSDTLLEASSVQAERRGKWQRDTDGGGRVEIVPVLNKFASNVPRAGTPTSVATVAPPLSSIAIQQSSPAEDYRGAASYVKGGQNFAVNQRTRHPAKDNVPLRDQEGIHEETTLRGSEVDVHDVAKENASVEQDVRPDDSSSGPATPLMDETEEVNREKDEDDVRMDENEDLEIGEGWKEDEIKQSGGERTEERKPMEESLVSTMEDKQQQEGVRDVPDGMLERKDEVRECKETDMSMTDSKAGETSAMYSAGMAVDTGEKCISKPPGRISEPPGRISELPGRISEPPGVDSTALETCSSGTVDGGPKETWEGHQKGDQKGEQSCKVVLHDIQLQPGLAESAEVCAEEGEKMSVKDEGAVTVGVGGSDGKVSWVEELEEGIVEVHSEVVDEEEVEDDNPPTPTQDELVDTGEEEEELMVGTTEEFQDGEMGHHASLVARGVIGDYQERGTTESIITTTAEERRPTSEIDQGGAGQETTSVTDQPDSVPASEVTVGRRSRRSVSDRHSKDEDFVYFGIRRKSRQKSQSPTPSLQSNESESSHTSSRSSRSSRRNSGRSADTEEKKPEVTAIRKRHASQELPSTSVGEDRPRRSRRSSPPNRYSPSESATQRLPKRRKSPSPTPQSQHEVPSRRTSKREHYTRHSTSSKRDSDFIYDMPKRRSDRNSIEERPPKRKR